MTSPSLRTPDDLGLTDTGAEDDARILHLMTPSSFDSWYQSADESKTTWITANGFLGNPGRAIMMPDTSAIGIVGDEAPIWDGASIAVALPSGSWQITTDEQDADINTGEVALGW